MKPKAATDQPRRTCGECANGTPDYKFENLSLDGKPTLVSCPYKPYKQVVTQKSCNLFKAKEL